MNEEKIYIGSGKIRTFDNGGHVVNCSICLSSILPDIQIPQIAEHIRGFAYKSDDTGKIYLNLNVNQKKEPDRFGKTHSVSVDTFKPTKTVAAPADDCPF